MKPLPDNILDGLIHLPVTPAHPLVGSGFRRAKFPSLQIRGPRYDLLYRVWACIPDAHKNRDLWSISPEAFNVLANFLSENEYSTSNS